MAFEKKVPEWKAAGTEPPESLKTSGFQAKYKPPAAYFNWFWHGVSEALAELQAASPRDIGALAEEAVYYSSAVEVDINTATQSLLLVDKKWSKDCPLCTDSGFVFIMQLFFGDPTASTSRTQIAFSCGDGGNSKPKGIALRCYFNGVWSDWTELYSPHNKPTPSDIGAATTDHHHDGRYYKATDVERGANMVLAAPDNVNGDATFRKLVDNDLPVVPITKGGTGTTGWQQALTNLRAMERQAVYYSATSAPNIDTLTDSLMLIPIEYSKDCPVSGGFVYIMQMFYANISVSANRTQIAFPYMTEGVVGEGIAIRSYYNGTWGAWQHIHSGTIGIEHGGTGGTTKNSAVANLFCRMLINNTSIVDANTLVHTGIHKVYVTDSTLATNNHYPYVYGNLFVVSNMESTSYTYVMQMFFTTDGGVFVRASTNNGSTWTDWDKTYSTNNKPTPADIGAVQVVTGSYSGNGSTSKSLTFNFKPLAVVITKETADDNCNGGFMWVSGCKSGQTEPSSYATVTWSVNGVSWSHSWADNALNVSGKTYHYVAIG